MRSLITAAALAASFALPAWAAQTPEQSGTPQTMGQTQGGTASTDRMQHARIEQRLRDDLSRAGFSDIRVVPESFLVRAKNAEGMPVMMVVNPDSIAAVTTMKSSHQTAHQTGQDGMSAAPGTVGSSGGNTAAGGHTAP